MFGLSVGDLVVGEVQLYGISSKFSQFIINGTGWGQGSNEPSDCACNVMCSDCGILKPNQPIL